MDDILIYAISESTDLDVELHPTGRPNDLEYADDIAEKLRSAHKILSGSCACLAYQFQQT